MNDSLMHYGILGMKWGVRRTPEQLGHVRAKRKKKPTYNVSPRKVKKNMKYMTDQELQRSINRMNMQNQVKNLNPSVIDKGKKHLKNYAAVLGAVTAAVAMTKTFNEKTIMPIIDNLAKKYGLSTIDITDWSRFY